MTVLILMSPVATAASVQHKALSMFERMLPHRLCPSVQPSQSWSVLLHACCTLSWLPPEPANATNMAGPCAGDLPAPAAGILQRCDRIHLQHRDLLGAGHRLPPSCGAAGAAAGSGRACRAHQCLITSDRISFTAASAWTTTHLRPPLVEGSPSTWVHLICLRPQRSTSHTLTTFTAFCQVCDIALHRPAGYRQRVLQQRDGGWHSPALREGLEHRGATCQLQLAGGLPLCNSASLSHAGSRRFRYSVLAPCTEATLRPPGPLSTAESLRHGALLPAQYGLDECPTPLSWRRPVLELQGRAVAPQLLVWFCGNLQRQLWSHAGSTLVQACLRCPSRRSMPLHMKQSPGAWQKVVPPPGCRWAGWALRHACMRCMNGHLCTVLGYWAACQGVTASVLGR